MVIHHADPFVLGKWEYYCINMWRLTGGNLRHLCLCWGCISVTNTVAEISDVYSIWYLDGGLIFLQSFEALMRVLQVVHEVGGHIDLNMDLANCALVVPSGVRVNIHIWYGSSET